MTSPLSTIGTIEVANKTVEGKVIGVVVRHLVPGTYLLHVDIQDGNRADFYHQGGAIPSSTAGLFYRGAASAIESDWAPAFSTVPTAGV